MIGAPAAQRRAITGLRPSLTIAEHCGEIRKILEGAGFRNAKDFGSIARGEDTEESNDLLMGHLGYHAIQSRARIELEFEEALCSRSERLFVEWA
jgi:predicted nucleotidyltransferase